MPKKPTSSHTCDICGSRSDLVRKVIKFNDGWICSECLEEQRELFQAMVDKVDEVRAEFLGKTDAKESVQTDAKPSFRVPSAKQIKDRLDQYVIGQDEAKKTLSVAVHNHYKRIEAEERGISFGEELKDVDLEKSNILLVGPTGCGKTLLASTLAKFLDVPFAIADATTVTEAGYVGEDVEGILLALIRAAGMDIQKAEKGIVFIDEIDKIARRTGNVSITRDVSGEGVQQALLKILEDTEAHVPPAGGRKHPEQPMLNIRTRNILFICGGAFVGLDKIMERRRDVHKLGFGENAEQKPVSKNPEPEDFIEFGLIPEFVGRLPVVTTLENLDEDALVRILKEPKNSLLKQFVKKFLLEGINLSFEDGALRAIAHEAVIRKTGARGLRAIMEKLMLDVMYENSVGTDSECCTMTKKLVITSDMVNAFLSEGKSIAGFVKRGR